jgi:hypothetical protein
MDRSFRWTGGARSVSGIGRSVATHRFIVCLLDSAGLGQELASFHNARPLKASAESGRRYDKRWVGVTFLKRVVFGM